jgi:hypothetical protein
MELGEASCRLYEANITWTGNRGQGTSAYAAYDRDHVAHTNQISRCPRTRRFWATPRGTIQRTCLSWRFPHATCFGICNFAPMPGLSSGPMKIARPAACSNRSRAGGFEFVLLRPKVTVESGDIQKALRLHQDAHKPAIQHASKPFWPGFWGALARVRQGPP